MHRLGRQEDIAALRPAQKYRVNHDSAGENSLETSSRRRFQAKIAPISPPKHSGFHPYFATQATDWAEYNGFWMANAMTAHGPIFEYAACRSKTAIADLSSLRKFDISGPDAVALLQHCLTRDIGRQAVGQVVYAAMCHAHGGIIDDGTLYGLGDGLFRWVCAIDASGQWLSTQARALGLDAQVRDVTDQQSNIALQGRGSRDILAAVFPPLAGRPAVEALGWFRFTLARVHGDGPLCLISRTGYTGELGFEVFCDPAEAMVVQAAIGAAGEPHGLTPIGMKAMDVLRIEAGLPFLGHEFNEAIDPFEGGLGFAVDLGKDGDFIGRAALEAAKANPKRKLVGLVVDAILPPAAGDAVWLDDVRVGAITSATCSLVLKKTIAMAHIDAPLAAPGGAVHVSPLAYPTRRRAATVTTLPFFDPTKSRIRGDYGA